MSDADCTPGREPRSVAASNFTYSPRRGATTLPADRRRGTCYLRVPPGAVDAAAGDTVRPCRVPLGETMSRSTCCCTVGGGWTDSDIDDATCQLCPRNGSRQYIVERRKHSAEFRLPAVNRVREIGPAKIGIHEIHETHVIPINLLNPRA